MLGCATLHQLEDDEGKPWLVHNFVFMKSIRTTVCSYRSLFAGEKRAARPTASVFSISLSDFGFLKSDGRFRIWTSFLNCWHRAFCWKRKQREEVKQSYPRSTTNNFTILYNPVEWLQFFLLPSTEEHTASITLLSNDLHC